MALRIGRVPYLHAEPFYFDMARRGMALVELVPRAVAVAAANGDDRRRASAAGGLCCAWRTALSRWRGFASPACSTLAVPSCSRPSPSPRSPGRHIGVTDEAATALRLLDVLLRLKYQVQPAAYGPLQARTTPFSSLAIKASASVWVRQASPIPTTWEPNGTPGPDCRLSSRAGWCERM